MTYVAREFWEASKRVDGDDFNDDLARATSVIPRDTEGDLHSLGRTIQTMGMVPLSHPIPNPTHGRGAYLLASARAQDPLFPIRVALHLSLVHWMGQSLEKSAVPQT